MRQSSFLDTAGKANYVVANFETRGFRISSVIKLSPKYTAYEGMILDETPVHLIKWPQRVSNFAKVSRRDLHLDQSIPVLVLLTLLL